MEILSLLKANIRNKKGTFFSIMILTTIIVTCMTAIFSVKDNYTEALSNAFTYADCGDTVAFVRTDRLTEEVCHKLEDHELVEKVTYLPAFASNGTTIGEVEDGNSYFFLELPEGIRLFNENTDGYEEEIPALKQGEIYLPLGLRSKLECEVGDTVTVYFIFGQSAEFVIKGFVQEPTQGAMLIGWKQVFISAEDFAEIYARCKPLETEEVTFDFTRVQIHQSEDSALTSAKFQRQVNLDTKIIDLASGAITMEQSIRYSTLLPEVVMNIVLVFVAFLFVIVLIVMSHSISTEIEIDYVTLGILKAQGFTKGKIRFVIMLQYMLAEVLGIVVGSLVAIPIERELSRLCQSITAVLPQNGLAVGKSILYTLLILGISLVLIIVKTSKIASISPVRAIAGGREEIYFDHYLQAPITKKGLFTSLSFRQVTSAKNRYFGTIFIVAILAFFMITANLTGNLLSSRDALAAMGLPIPDLQMQFTDATITDHKDHWKEINEIISSHTEVVEENSIITGYASLNGENLYVEVYWKPEYILSVYSGREPLYDNEIVITEMVADTLELQVGDEVTVTFQDGEDTFIISGLFQSGSDSGMAFAMNFAGAEKLGGNTEYGARYYIIKDKDKTALIGEELQEKFGENLALEMYEDQTFLSGYDGIVDALKVLIYTVSVVFAFVVVRMVCTKTFVQERMDIGIYKAMGFTSKKLRLGFAIRFFLLAIVGSGLGVLLSVLFSGKLLGLALRLIGLGKVMCVYSVSALLIPMAAVSISFFVFAYLASYKIKGVAIRELVVE